MREAQDKSIEVEGVLEVVLSNYFIGVMNLNQLKLLKQPKESQKL